MKNIILALILFISLIGFSQNAEKHLDGVDIKGIIKADFNGIAEDTAIDSLVTWTGTEFKWATYSNFLAKLNGDITVSQSIKDLTDVYSSMSPSDGQVLTFDTTNGWQAEATAGIGDMLISIYDPTAVSADAFDMDNMVEGSTTKILTDTERTAIGNNTAKVTDDDEGVAEVYGVGWDADTDSPTKNDVYDKIETLGGSSTAPIMYNVKDYGAKGDGIDLLDGVITASDATFTSASNPFVSGDVGKTISIEGAGTSGAYHVTTIASYTGVGEVELTDVGVTTVSGASYFFGTDDTVNIQLTIQTAFDAGGGVVYIPNGIYIIGGVLLNNVGVDNVDYNSQLYIPEENFDDITRRSIEIEGEVQPNFNQSAGIGGAISPNTCTIFRSTIQGSGTRPSVLANRGASTNFQDISYTNLFVQKLSIQLIPDANSKLTMGGINCERSSIANFEFVTIFPYNLNLVDSGEPDVIDIVGISMPGVSTEWINTVRNCTVGGFTHGYTAGDHTNFYDATAVVCVNSFTQDFNNIISNYVKISSFWSINDFNVSGSSLFNVVSFQNEYATQGKWYDTVTTINDPSDNGVGTFNYHLAEKDIGYSPDGFVKNGGDKIITKPIAVNDLTNTQAGATYTFKILDAYRVVESTNASATTFTVPPDATLNYDIGATINVVQSGAGQLAIAEGAGVTINKTETLLLRKQYSTATITKTAPNTWVATGDFERNPTLISAIINDNDPTDVVMVFTQVVTGTNLGFTIGGTTSTTFSSISGSGTNTITGVLAVAATGAETVTLTYSKSTGDISNATSEPLQDITAYSVFYDNNYILDTQTAKGAYSFQKLRSGETESFKIRRDSDDAVTDVELEDSGSITLSSTVSAGGTLGTWLGSDDGYIHTIYDQSGNNNDFVQATHTNQALIATAGVLESKDGKVACTFVNDYYLATALPCMQGGNDASIFALASSDNLAYNGVLLSTHAGGSNPRLNMSVDTSTGKIFTYWNSETPTTTTQLSLLAQENSTDRRLQVFIKDATDMYSWLDGSAQNSSSYSGTIINGDLQLGAQMVGVTLFKGKLQELIIFATDQTSNRVTIETDINGRY